MRSVKFEISDSVSEFSSKMSSSHIKKAKGLFSLDF